MGCCICSWLARRCIHAGTRFGWPDARSEGPESAFRGKCSRRCSSSGCHQRPRSPIRLRRTGRRMAQTEIKSVTANFCKSLHPCFGAVFCHPVRHSLYPCGQNPAKHPLEVGLTWNHSCMPCRLLCHCLVHMTTMTEKARPALPFLLGLFLFVVGISGIALIAFPDIVPFGVTLWEAASSSTSQTLVLVGAAFVTPMVLAYSAFAYWIFRGKTPEQGWEA